MDLEASSGVGWVRAPGFAVDQGREQRSQFGGWRVVAMAPKTVPGRSSLSHFVTERANHVRVPFAEDGEVLFVELFTRIADFRRANML
jgi:hypothetical protein